jgi:putative PIN family toxin of toxin-antitoxin system
VKAVFDTNIFVSALMFPGGRAEAALMKVIEGEVELRVSKSIIHEVLGVLSRKFDRDPEELARVAVYLADLGKVVQPKSKLTVLRDEPDNRILECAIAGRADVIVTGDQAMLALGKYKDVSIVTLKDFLTDV